ncbi:MULTISPECIES: hypothetical protein [Lysobacteraceae]|uniref:hypothetical protein n=1 Tax=Lysobacteraceae TaxID=32033 RepID=UPI0013A660DD|nr:MULTISPECIES: hypothetical protein [Xanthomonadaceae]
MERNQPSKLSGYLLIAAGLSFFAAAFNNGQNAFTALGVVFVVLGIGALRKASSRSNDSSGPAA